MSESDSFPGSIDQRGPSWRWRVQIDGERFTYTLPRDGDDKMPPDPTRDDVIAFARREAKELEKELTDGRGRPTHLSGLFDRYVDRKIPSLAEGSQPSYRRAVKRFRQYFVENGSNPRIRHVRTDDCAAYLSWRRWHSHDGSGREEPLAGNTIRKDRTILSNVFAKAVAWEYRTTNPVHKTDRPKIDERDPVILTDERYERLLAEADNSKNLMLALYVLLLGETGLRSESEGNWIRWEDIDWEEGFLWVWHGHSGHRTKGGEGRWVPLTPRLLEALKEHAARYRMKTYEGERTPWIFHHQFAFKDTQPGDRIACMKSGFANAAERAQLPDEFRKHDLRHRRVTTWLEDGHPVVKVQRAMGHADIKTTEKYYRFVRGHLKSLVEPPPVERAALGEMQA